MLMNVLYADNKNMLIKCQQNVLYQPVLLLRAHCKCFETTSTMFKS